MRIGRKIFLTTVASIIALVMVFFFCLYFGTSHIGIQKFFSILMDHAGIKNVHKFTRADEVILIDIRMPRIIIASLVGGGLAIVGGVILRSIPAFPNSIFLFCPQALFWELLQRLYLFT
jgi:iron complex transport system permease protein